MTILKFEIKKMLRSKTSMAAIGFLILLTVGLCIGYILGGYYAQEDGSKIFGIKAAARMREAREPWKGMITEEVIAKVIEENKRLCTDPAYRGKDGWLTEEGYSRQQGFYDLRSLINDTYRESFSDYDYFTCDRLSPDDAEVFYDKKEAVFDEWLGREEVAQNFSEEKRAYIREHALNVETPYYYEYYDGWKKVKEMNLTLVFGAVIVVCIVLAGNFSAECQTKADAIYFSTRLGKKTGNKMKIAAGFILATVIYWGAMLSGSGVLFLAYGTSGGKVPVQLEFYKGLYSLTQAQAWFLVLLLGYIGCMSMGGLTMLMSSKFRSSFVAIILSFLIIMVPAIAAQSVYSTLWKDVLSLFPHGAIMGYDYLTTYVLYQFGDRVYSPFEVLMPLHMLVTLLTIPFTYCCFQKYKA